MELLNDKNAAPGGPRTEGPWANPQLLLASATVKPEDLTVTGNPQSPPLAPFPACRCPLCGPGFLFDEQDVGAAHGQHPPRLTSLRAEGLQESPAVHSSLLPRMAALPHGKDFPTVQVKAWMHVPEQMACAGSISVRRQLIAALWVTYMRRVERIKNEVVWGLREKAQAYEKIAV